MFAEFCNFMILPSESQLGKSLPRFVLFGTMGLYGTIGFPCRFKTIGPQVVVGLAAGITLAEAQFCGGDGGTQNGRCLHNKCGRHKDKKCFCNQIDEHM